MNRRWKLLLGGVVTVGMIVTISPTLFSQTLSPAELQTRIQQLFDQLTTLQAQVNTAQGSGTQTGSVVTCAFARDLFSGARGEDVRCLQRYLNNRGFKVAETGPGSAGSETDHFGELTRKALIRWQEAFGISPAVGYFGPLSRKKYSELISSAGGTTPVTTGKVKIDSVTPSSGPAGTQVVIRGSGITDDSNRLNFGGTKDVVTDILGFRDAIVVAIPKSAEFGAGTHLLSVSNKNGESNELEFRITTTPIGITEITPSEGDPGAVVTIRGFGFTPTGNTIYVGDALIEHKTVSNVPSADGKTLTFTFDPPAGNPDDFSNITTTAQFLEVLANVGMTYDQFKTGYTDDYQIVVRNSRGEETTDEVFFRGMGRLPF